MHRLSVAKILPVFSLLALTALVGCSNKNGGIDEEEVNKTLGKFVSQTHVKNLPTDSAEPTSDSNHPASRPDPARPGHKSADHTNPATTANQVSSPNSAKSEGTGAKSIAKSSSAPNFVLVLPNGKSVTLSSQKIVAPKVPLMLAPQALPKEAQVAGVATPENSSMAHVKPAPVDPAVEAARLAKLKEDSDAEAFRGGNQGFGAFGVEGTGGNMANVTTNATDVNSPCYSVVYRHKALNSHPSEEFCASHRNVIKLKHDNVNPKTVCIRVNNQPVAFEFSKEKKDEVIIGAIAGPQAKVTATYCTGSHVCKDDCTIAKDDFMAAIGNGEDDQSALNAVKATEHSELKRELASIGETQGLEESTLFKDWLGSQPQAACN